MFDSPLYGQSLTAYRKAALSRLFRRFDIDGSGTIEVGFPPRLFMYSVEVITHTF